MGQHFSCDSTACCSVRVPLQEHPLPCGPIIDEAKSPKSRSLSEGAPTLLGHGRSLKVEMSKAEQTDIIQRLAGRNISLGQLLSLHEELTKTKIIGETIKTFEFVRDFVIPTTAPESCAFMESSFMYQRGGPKPPYKLVSHWWGADLCNTIVSAAEDASGLEPKLLLEKLIEGSLLKLLEEEYVFELDSAYWFCFLAVNQHTSICGTELNPCSCSFRHYESGDPMCEVDKFPAVLSHMHGGLTMSLDPDLKVLTRVWCLAELSTALHSNIRMSFTFPRPIRTDIKEKLGAGKDVTPHIENCEASVQEDKDRILDSIRSTIGLHRFNLEVRVLVQMYGPFVSGFGAWRMHQAPAPWEELMKRYNELAPGEKRLWRNREVDSFDRARFCSLFVHAHRCEMTYARGNGDRRPVLGLPIRWEAAKKKFNKPVGEKEFDGDLPDGMKVFENKLTGCKLFSVSAEKEIYWHDFGRWEKYKDATLIFFEGKAYSSSN